MTKNSVGLLSALALIAFASAGCTADQKSDTPTEPGTPAAAERPKVRIGWVFAMANAPVVIAKEKKFFAAAGVDATTISFTSGPLVHQALAAGQLDMAYIGSPPVYHWYSRGLKSQIVAKVNYGQAAVLAKKGSGIDKLADLKGKKIAGVRKGSGMDVLLRGYVLGRSGKLKPDEDVRIVPMPSGNMGQSMAAGVVDAAFVWEPFVSQSELRGSGEVIFDMNEAVPGYPWYVVMSLPDFLKNNRDTVRKVLVAHQRAVDFLNSSKGAGNDIIAREFKLKPVTDGSGKTHSAEDIVANARNRLGWSAAITAKDMEFIQGLMDDSHTLGYIKSPLKAGDLVDSSVLAELSK